MGVEVDPVRLQENLALQEAATLSELRRLPLPAKCLQVCKLYVEYTYLSLSWQREAWKSSRKASSNLDAWTSFTHRGRVGVD